MEIRATFVEDSKAQIIGLCHSGQCMAFEIGPCLRLYFRQDARIIRIKSIAFDPRPRCLQHRTRLRTFLLVPIICRNRYHSLFFLRSMRLGLQYADDADIAIFNKEKGQDR
ncbi:hypothetical protein DMP17_08740 [Pseudonocardia sp. TMWB2A]